MADLHDRLLAHLQYQQGILQDQRSTNNVTQSLYLALALVVLSIIASKDAWDRGIAKDGYLLTFPIAVVGALDLFLIWLAKEAVSAFNNRVRQIKKRRKINSLLQAMIFENESGRLHSILCCENAADCTASDLPILKLVKVAEHYPSSTNQLTAASILGVPDEHISLINNAMESEGILRLNPHISMPQSGQRPNKNVDSDLDFKKIWQFVLFVTALTNFMIMPQFFYSVTFWIIAITIIGCSIPSIREMFE